MAYFDEKSGQIIFSPDDEEIFQEANYNVQHKKTPISDRIMKSILKE